MASTPSVRRRRRLFFLFQVAIPILALLPPGGDARVCLPCGSTAVPYPLSTVDAVAEEPIGRGPVRAQHVDALLRRAQRHLLPDHLHLPGGAAPRRLPGAAGVQGQLRVGGGGGRARRAARPVAAVQRELLQHHHAAQLHGGAAAVAAQLLVHLALPRLRRRHGLPLRAAAALLHLRGGRLVDVVQDPRVAAVLQRLQQLRGARPRRASGGVGPPPRPGAAVGGAEGAALPHAGRLRGRGQRSACSDDPLSALKRCFCVPGLVWSPLAGACQQNLSDCQRAGDCEGSNHAPLIAGIVCGLGGALLVTAAGLFFYRRQRRIRIARETLTKEREEILNANNSSGRTAKNFTSGELKRATANFSRDNLLGVGGYGEVYRGVLADGTPVAVKCAKLGNTKSTDQILNEVRVLSQVNHRSLVRLLGCCVDLQQPLMVYEFIPNGTIADHLYGAASQPPLPWRRRLAVARQTAEGIAYLHFSASPPIYHRDIKSSNILLDEQLDGKVSDFGLSRLAEPGLSHVSTCAQGTLGYLDPEYYRNYQLTDKSDVYSFGVVLLELLTSKRAIDFARGEDDVNLAVHVQRAAEEDRLLDVLDPAMKNRATQLELDTMKALGFLALGCLEERRQNRPSMKEVADEIEYIINIEAGASVVEQ